MLRKRPSFGGQLPSNYLMYLSLYQQGERIMATIEEVQTSLDELDAQIVQLGEQVAAGIASAATPEQLDEVKARIDSAAAAVDAIIEPDAGETPAEPAP